MENSLAEKKERKKRDTSKKHRLILDKAIEVFTQKGFEETSMDVVAEYAGVSKRTIYNHFKSKDNLFKEIVKEFITARDKIKPVEYSNNKSIKVQLKEFAKAEIFLIEDPKNRGLSKLLTSTFLINIEYGKEIYGSYSPYKNFIEWLEKAKQDKKLDFESAMLTANIFYGLVEGCITWRALMSDGASLQTHEIILEEIIDVFINKYETVIRSV